MTDDASRAPSALRSLFELLGLSGLTVAQPLLATFGDSPDFFIFRQSSRVDIVLFALAIAVVPATAVWVATLLIGLVSRVARGVAHHAALGAFTAVGVLQVTSAAGMSLVVGVPLAIGAGGALVAAVLRWGSVRSWLALTAPAPAAFIALFLFAAPTGALVTGGDVDPARLGPFGSGDPPPVVVMVFDEWPLSSIVRTDGTIDRDLAPNVARLADDATWYRNATTVSNMTNFAVPAILTGNVPQPGDRAEASDQPQNLFTLLGDTYDLEVKESLTRLCPPSLCNLGRGEDSAADRASRLGDLLGAASGVMEDRLRPGEDGALVTDVFVEPDAAVNEAERDGESFNLEELLAPRPERLDDFVNGMEPDEEPTVHYVHVLGPHTPYRHTPDGIRYPSDSSLRLISAPDGAPGSDLRADVAWPALLDRQRLLLEVGYVDLLIGEVLDELQADDLYEDALVVLTSDHGIGFEPGGTARGLGEGPVERSVEADLLYVPLIVKAPGQTVGIVDDVDARTIDVVPTIAGHLGIEMPWEVDGRDLNDDTSRGRGPKEFVRVAGSSFAVFSLDDPVEIRADMGEVFERGTDALLSGDGPERWWRVGPDPELVGVRVGDVELRASDDLTVRFDDAEALADIDLASGEAPLLVSGRISGDTGAAPGDHDVAILVDEVVAAVVPTYDDGNERGRFAAMMNPMLFEAGPARVRLATVTRSANDVVLTLLPES